MSLLPIADGGFWKERLQAAVDLWLGPTAAPAMNNDLVRMTRMNQIAADLGLPLVADRESLASVRAKFNAIIAAINGSLAQTSAILGAGGLDYALYDTSLPGSLFQNSAGTTPAGLGDPVGRWNVRQKPPHSASQTVNGSRPVRQAKGLKGDASDDSELTDWLAGPSAGCIIMQGTMPLTVSSNQVIAGTTLSGGISRVRLTLNGNGQACAALGAIGEADMKGVNDLRGKDAVLIFTWGGHGSTQRLFEDGAQVYSGTQSGAANQTVPFRLFALNTEGTASGFFGGTIKRIAFGHTALTPEQAQVITAEWLNVA